MGKGIYKNIILSSIFIFSFFYISFAENIIVVDYLQEVGKVNKNIFGQNILAHDPGESKINVSHYYGHADFGAGLWDPIKRSIPNEISYLIKEIGISSLRFPGGNGVRGYDWKRTVDTSRRNFLFGIDEFLNFSGTLRIFPVFTISYFTGTPQDAADMVEYLNSPDDGKHPWAAKRAKNGHKAPYGVKYFEVGNEVWNGDGFNISNVSFVDYANRYLQYYDRMKAIDSNIQVGIVLRDIKWSYDIFSIIRDKVDFGIVHVYPTLVWGEQLKKYSVFQIFFVSLAIPVTKYEFEFKEFSNIYKNLCGRYIPLAITEFNGGYTQEFPTPYRFTLGCALVNAELLRVFMEPENNILMAHHWNFINEYWGMVANGFKGDYKDLYNPYYKRPNYYVFQLYKEHFGDILLKMNIDSFNSYDIGVYDIVSNSLVKFINGAVVSDNLLLRGWNVLPVGGVDACEKDGLLVVNFSNPKNVNYYNCSKNALVLSNTYYKVSCYLKTIDFVSANGISLEIQDGRGWNITKSAVSGNKLIGTNDWTYVEFIYKTLPDAKAVKIYLRSAASSGILSGTVLVRDVKLFQLSKSVGTLVPYLSVNASKSKDGKKVYLMVVNKDLGKEQKATIKLNGFTPRSDGQAWVLNGPAVDATNEKNHNNVLITVRKFKVNSDSFEYTFEPHSLTAIELDKN